MGVSMINKTQILTNYGFKNGYYDKSADIVAEVNYNDEKGIAKLDGDKDYIDTPEEFLTATYFSPIEITDAKAKAEIEKELPANGEGGKKLCAMWLRKKVENPQNAANYVKIIDEIKKKAGITEEDVQAYYKTAMADEILTLGKQHLGKYYSEAQLKNSVLKPLIEYYKNPTTDNFNEIVRVGYYFMNNVLIENSKDPRPEAFVDILMDLNSSLCFKLDTAIKKEIRNPTLPPYKLTSASTDTKNAIAANQK